MSTVPDDVAGFRLERAKETLREAHTLADAGLWHGAMNRIYYTCFYGASALEARAGHSSSKHTGVRSFLNLRYIRTGLLAPELGQFYNEAFDLRLDGDYEDFFAFTVDNIPAMLERAKDFIARVEELLQINGG